MDEELAGAVLKRWEMGEPVFEGTLYKAAEALGMDPDLALLEARYYTALDNLLLEKRAMSEDEFVFFSLAAGHIPDAMEKTASTFGLTPDELVLRTLENSNWVPEIEKLAEAMADLGGAPAPGEAPPPGGQPPGMMPPQPGAQVQQQPGARMVQPTPTAPQQMAPTPEGNMQALIAQGQEGMGGNAMDNASGMAPAGMSEQQEPPSATERIQQVAQQLDQETLQRYATKLEEFEQQPGMQISDPKQMVKFVEGMQKVDSKRIDIGIKGMVEEETAAMEAEIGANQAKPQVKMPGMAGPPAGGAPTQPGAPKPGGPPQKPGAQKPGAPKPPGGEPPVPEDAMAKVAQAGRAMAHALRR